MDTTEAELLWLSGQRVAACEHLLWQCWLAGIPADDPIPERIRALRNRLEA